jgi:hypothetical protein
VTRFSPDLPVQREKFKSCLTSVSKDDILEVHVVSLQIQATNALFPLSLLDSDAEVVTFACCVEAVVLSSLRSSQQL